MKIRNARLQDIDPVAELERKIEKENAATKETLLARFNMFPQGFYVAEEGGNIVGYVESCLWDKKDFKTFDEIRDFPKHHKSNGKTLYVIFLGVAENHRRKGVGSGLTRTLRRYASGRQLERVQLVAGEGFLVDFYKRLGFGIVRQLPHFLPYSSGALMEYRVK